MPFLLPLSLLKQNMPLTHKKTNNPSHLSENRQEDAPFWACGELQISADFLFSWKSSSGRSRCPGALYSNIHRNWKFVHGEIQTNRKNIAACGSRRGASNASGCPFCRLVARKCSASCSELSAFRDDERRLLPPLSSSSSKQSDRRERECEIDFEEE